MDLICLRQMQVRQAHSWAFTLRGLSQMRCSLIPLYSLRDVARVGGHAVVVGRVWLKPHGENARQRASTPIALSNENPR
jgi:hypothetical protein